MIHLNDGFIELAFLAAYQFIYNSMSCNPFLLTFKKELVLITDEFIIAHLSDEVKHLC